MERSKPQYVTKLTLSKQDMNLIAEVELTVQKSFSKFMYTDINEQNLNFIARETTELAKQIICNHSFLDLVDLYRYKFSHMKIKVNVVLGNVEIIPCFVREGAIDVSNFKK